ncbi:hypothetical protein FRC04_006993 [Tulasnella sp. 424]|nr:hypothetical protein FRC04_006993 [Tulasnella sp. 424]
MTVREKRNPGTSWARWWSRSRRVEQQQGQQVPMTAAGEGALGVPAEVGVGRPALTPTASALVDLDMPEAAAPSSPPMGPSKTAPAAINVPSPSSASRPTSPPPTTMTTPPTKPIRRGITCRESSRITIHCPKDQ